MGLRGPKSENVKILDNVFKKRASAPKRLPKIARLVWKQIVESLPADHFKSSDLPLLEKYCMAEHVYWTAIGHVLSGDVAIVTEKGYALPDVYLTVANKQIQIQATLATKLRICPNSRVSGFKAAREKESPQSTRRGLMFGD